MFMTSPNRQGLRPLLGILIQQFPLQNPLTQLHIHPTTPTPFKLSYPLLMDLMPGVLLLSVIT